MTRAFLLGLLTAALMFGAAPARALSADAIAAALAERFGVKVLRVTPIERDGKQLLAVVVMHPGGNFNEAFTVTTLIADAETGELVPQFRAENSGYQLPQAANRQPPSDDGGAAIRRETFRGR
jgi:hypothetical protein